MSCFRFFILGLTVSTLIACDADSSAVDAAMDGLDGAVAGPLRALADYDAADTFAAPWPDVRFEGADGIDLRTFPNPRGLDVIDVMTETLRGTAGFAQSSGIFFPLSGAIDTASLPQDPAAAQDANASVFLVDIEPTSLTFGQRAWVDVQYLAQSGPYGPSHLLAMLPVQGFPLVSGHRYAAVITTALRDPNGMAILADADTELILNGRRPEGLSLTAYAAYEAALPSLDELGQDRSDIAAMAVIQTQDATLEFQRARTQVLAQSLPNVDGEFEAREVFDSYCVFQSAVEMPVFQRGAAPYTEEGGDWVWDDAGRLVEQRRARSNVWVTLPRAPMPENGFPLVVFMRVGGGGDRPLVDRGVRDASGIPLAAGSGPALEFARAGYAAISVDGPLGGLRNPDSWDEQYAIFNIQNLPALRDNIRQSALETVLVAHLAETLRVDASSCPGLNAVDVRFDRDDMALMGHSMGATIAPIAMAFEPRFRALLLSGAGASWIDNLIYKQSPLPVRPLAQGVLGYRGTDTMTRFDPVVSLVQWVGEPADPQLYARHILRAPPEGGPRQVLMMQGMLDTYIPPPIANALSLALGLDLAGDALDQRFSQYTSLTAYLPFEGGVVLPYPAQGNRAEGQITAVVTQHPEDGVEDGHEVVFQTDAPKRQYRCFLQTLRTGAGRVTAGIDDSCE